MHRFVNPRALGLALLGLVLMGVMGWLGRWQFSVYDDHQHAQALAALRQPPVPLGRLLGRDAAFPADGVSRPVTVSGTYLAGEQLYVRHLAGASHRYAVVTPLVTVNGSAVLVVRGSRDTVGAVPPRGQVTVRGILEPSGVGGPPNSQRVANGLSVSSLVGAVTPDLYSGYVVQQVSTPRQAPTLAPVVPPLPDPSRWAGLRNLLYACQWWVFAGFVAFMWWRMTGDLEAQEHRRVPAADAGSDSMSSLG
ncbi:MAG: hypothetical protein QOI51_1746 [Nocardioidaceae bacterium]|nr:hypothetical protein [Nocardioidaceae bacterium]